MRIKHLELLAALCNIFPVSHDHLQVDVRRPSPESTLIVLTTGPHLFRISIKNHGGGEEISVAALSKNRNEYAGERLFHLEKGESIVALAERIYWA